MLVDNKYTVRMISPDSDLLVEIMKNLMEEYASIYGDYFSRNAIPEKPAWFRPPDGAFLILENAEEIVAMGGYKRLNDDTAEFKRIWSNAKYRRQGLAGLILDHLEAHAFQAGYEKIYLTTGFRQRGAMKLYLQHGFEPLYDLSGDLERYSVLPYNGKLGFIKRINDKQNH